MTAAGLLAIGVGAALGAWLRWALSAAMNPILPSLPLGTLAANVVGGLLVGAAIEVFSRPIGLAPEWRLFVITGFLGGLTTFSTFSAEVVDRFQHGEATWALAVIVVHLAGALAATWAGIVAVRAVAPA